MEKKKITIFILGLLFFILSGCDCWQESRGNIYDKETNEPLDSVVVTSYTKDEYTADWLSDTLGYFEASTHNTGKCNGYLKVKFEKEGYKTQEIVDPDSEIIVRMEKE